jgi:hypothetical protein
MHWILQENLFKEKEWENLTTALERFNIPYSVHKVIPFIGELLPKAEPKQEKVICVGSYSMRHTAKAEGWSPGVYDLFDQDFLVQLVHWGTNMLNHDSTIVAFKDAEVTEDSFIRPINDSKYFAGQVFEKQEFLDWKRKVCVLEHDYGNSMTGDTVIQICSPKVIYAEYRFWIIDGKIATESLYKRGDKVMYSSEVDERFAEFVNRMISIWMPHRAFVIDVCDTPDGIKIVEINTLTASGFYAGDIQKLVMALEGMEK